MKWWGGAIIKTEMMLWWEILLKVGNATLPDLWLKYKINRIFSTRLVRKTAKELCSYTLIITIMRPLWTQRASSDSIAHIVALRNICILLLGFYHLLRRSEIMAVQWEHFQWGPSGGTLFIPRSKTE